MRKNSSYGAVARAPRAAAVALTAVGLLAAGLAAPAAARPPIGPVKALTAQITKPGANYRVAADWADLTGAVSYKVTLIRVGTGTVLATDTVTASEWTVPTSAPVNSQVKVTVQPRSSTRNGRSASITKMLPDLTAPVGSYDVSWTGYDATVSELALSDDLSLPAAITREINWGEEGGAFEPWTTGTSLNHGYPAVDARYVPQVRLTDQHENTVTLLLHAVVIGDTAAPVGVFGTTAPAKVWARYTPVTVAQSELSDDFSPANKVVRVVDWGDGSVPTPWTAGLTLSHVYQVGGTFTPKVAMADEAGNTTTADAAAVTVLVDNLAPKVTLTVPKYGVRAVRSWRTIKGKAKDAGVGMGKVLVRAVEKRGAVWYSYLPAKKIWVRGGNTRVAALKFAGIARISPSATNAWQLRLVNLRKGTLVIQYSAIDKALNRTKFFTRVQLLVKS
jgi:hypothetical protein